MFAAHTYEDELPPDDVCAALANLAVVLKAMGDHEAADAAYRRALNALAAVEREPAQRRRALI